MKKYLKKNTMYLTDSGLKTIDEINLKEDNIIYLGVDGGLHKTNKYSLDKKYFDEVYENYNNAYGHLVSNEIEIPHTYVDFTEDDISLKISKFFIKSKDKDRIWYEDFGFDKTLSLALVISNYFDLDEDEYVEMCDFVDYNIVKSTFIDFNKLLGIYFPFNRETRSYTFKTNLHRDFHNLETKLLDSIYYAKTFSKTLFNIVLRGYNYRSIVLRSYNIGCLLQIYFNLSGYDTKLVQEGECFRLTVVKVDDNNCAHREKSADIGGHELGNITLDDEEGYLIVSQCTDGITNVSFIESI